MRRDRKQEITRDDQTHGLRVTSGVKTFSIAPETERVTQMPTGRPEESFFCRGCTVVKHESWGQKYAIASSLQCGAMRRVRRVRAAHL